MSDITFTDETIEDFIQNPEKFESLYESFRSKGALCFDVGTVSLPPNIDLNNDQLNKFLKNYHNIHKLDYSNNKNLKSINLDSDTHSCRITKLDLSNCEQLTTLTIHDDRPINNDCPIFLTIDLKACKSIKTIHLKGFVSLKDSV